MCINYQAIANSSFGAGTIERPCAAPHPETCAGVLVIKAAALPRYQSATRAREH